MATLYVIAGPNGAGKSTLATAVLPEGLQSFDGDKEMKMIQAKFPSTEDSQIFSHVNEVLFPQAKLDAIKDGRDFAYETNLTTDAVVDTLQAFVRAGYQTELIFIGLPSVEQAMVRVQLRVAQGGHSVAPDLVRSNYREGLVNLAKYISRFDRAIVLENAVRRMVSLPRMVAKFQKGKMVEKAKEVPKWAEGVVGMGLVRKKRGFGKRGLKKGK